MAEEEVFYGPLERLAGLDVRVHLALAYGLLAGARGPQPEAQAGAAFDLIPPM